MVCAVVGFWSQMVEPYFLVHYNSAVVDFLVCVSLSIQADTVGKGLSFESTQKSEFVIVFSKKLHLSTE